MRFVLLGCIWDSLVVLQHLVQNGPKWCKSSCHEIASEFFAMNTLDPPHSILNHIFVCFVLFGCIWDYLVALQNSVQNRPKWCKSSCHEVASGFIPTNAPNRPHWTINSCFSVSHSVWVHFGLFHYCAKLGAKRVELVQLKQKFVPRSRIGIFRNEC